MQFGRTGSCCGSLIALVPCAPVDRLIPSKQPLWTDRSDRNQGVRLVVGSTVHPKSIGWSLLFAGDKLKVLEARYSWINPLAPHQKHMANGAMPTSKATENDCCVSAIWRNCHDSVLTVLCTNTDVNTGGFWSHFKDRGRQPQRLTTLKHIYK